MSDFLGEFKNLTKLFFPILIAQLALAGLGVVDTIMAGQVGKDDLAAIGLGSSILFPVMMLSVGFLIVLTTLVAKQFGKQNIAQMQVFFQQAIWLAIPLGLLVFLILINSRWVLDFLPLTDNVHQLTEGYLFYIAFGLPALSIYFVFRFFWEGIGLTMPTMWISILTVLVNTPLNAVFIYGWGVDVYGAAGCGIASAITMWLMMFVAIGYAVTSEKIKPYLQFSIKSFMRPVWKNGLQTIFTLGLPNTLSILFEVSLFSFIALFIAVLGTDVIAAQQVGVSYTSMLFMIPLSISMAITIRVGHAYGKGLKQEVYQRVYAGLLMAFIAGILSAIFTYLVRESIAEVFTDDLTVITIAIGLLSIAAVYHVFDAVQIACSGVLRGLHNTKIIMQVTFFCYWVIGLGGGYLMAFTSVFIEPAGLKGFWYAIVLGFFVAAVVLFVSMMSQLKKLERQGEIS